MNSTNNPLSLFEVCSNKTPQNTGTILGTETSYKLERPDLLPIPSIAQIMLTKDAMEMLYLAWQNSSQNFPKCFLTHSG